MTINAGRAEGGAPALSLPFYLAVALISGAIIAFQIATMRAFSIASWAHFGSLVVSIAMFGFGVVSAAMCIAKGHFQRHAGAWAAGSLLVFGPMMIAANTLAQTLDFNPIFLISDPQQPDRLLALFVLYFLPFLPGALFLGLVFLKGQRAFGKVYFANMAGSGLGGLTLLLSMYVILPDRLLLVPLGMWFIGAAVWFGGAGARRPLVALAAAGAAAVAVVLTYSQIAISPYKGVSYARAFPDAERLYQSASPLGLMEVYRSTYFHFAPGLSDMAALNLPDMPTDAFLGMYIDGDGPMGVMRALPQSQLGYFRYLPMHIPYVLRNNPSNVFVVQLGGGISANVALAAGARAVTVAEGNPMVLGAVRDDPTISEINGHLLSDPRVTVVPYDGRLYAGEAPGRFDVIDFSLADSTGLASPGGISIFEQYAYTSEAMQAYMRALAPGGLLAVTVWDRETPPKAVLKLFSTMMAAAHALNPGDVANRFYISHTYLSTVTVLYSRDGFTPEEIARLDQHSQAMAFEVLYRPGMDYDISAADAVFQAYRDMFFNPERLAAANAPPAAASAEAQAGQPGATGDEGGGGEAADSGEAGGGAAMPAEPEGDDSAVDITTANLYRIVLHYLVAGDFERVRSQYVFDVSPLTNDRPYFAGYIKPGDLTTFAGMLDVVSDQWGYLLLWATLGLAAIFGVILLLIPVAFGWRTIFAPQPGKVGIALYFLGLGLGYIVIEIGLISKFMLALTNPTLSASVLITGMLVFSGTGSYLSGRFLDRCRTFMPKIFVGIAALIVLYALGIDWLLGMIGSLPYGLRIVACLALLFPLAFLMGFPFATGMATLARLDKEHFFLWAWGINGSFSVVGAVLVPLVGVLFGLRVVLLIAALCYLMCWPAFFSLLRPRAQSPLGVPAPARAG